MECREPGLGLRLGWIIAVFWTFAAASAQAGEFTCAEAETADTIAVTKAPESFLGRCVRLRGMLGAAPKVGATIAAAPRPDGEKRPRLNVYFEGNDVPEGLAGHERFAEIVGRVLGCSDIGKNAMEAAARANEEDPTTFHTGMVMGTCHYRDDAFAILVSSYKMLPAPPPGRTGD